MKSSSLYADLGKQLRYVHLVQGMTPVRDTIFIIQYVMLELALEVRTHFSTGLNRTARHVIVVQTNLRVEKLR